VGRRRGRRGRLVGICPRRKKERKKAKVRKSKIRLCARPETVEELNISLTRFI